MESCFCWSWIRWVGLQFISCDLSDNRELTDKEGDYTTETDSSNTESSLEVDSTTDHNYDSESDLWEGFDFPQLTAEEDAQLTIALQGDTSQPTTSIEASTTMSPQEAMMDSFNMRSGVQVPTDQATSGSGPSSSSPPPYTTESNNSVSQPGNQFFLVDNNSMIPISASTDGQYYVAVDGVYHVMIRQM